MYGGGNTRALVWICLSEILMPNWSQLLFIWAVTLKTATIVRKLNIYHKAISVTFVIINI